MHIKRPEDLGEVIRSKRKKDGLTLQEAAAVCGVSYAFVSGLENGKETVRLNKVLDVLNGLGITLSAAPRGWEAGEE